MYPVVKDNDETFLWTIDFPCMVVDDMTMLIAWKDKKDVLLAADGCGMIDGDAQHDQDIKTIRINNNLAIGIAGSAYHAYLVLVDLLGHPVPAGKEEEFTKIWEDNDYSANNVTFSGIEECVVRRIPEVSRDQRWIDYLSKHDNKPSLILIAGNDGPNKRIIARKANEDGSICYQEEPERIISGPCNKSSVQQNLVLNALRSQGRTSDKLVKAIRQCANFPNSVNKNVSIRRMGDSSPFRVQWWIEKE